MIHLRSSAQRFVARTRQRTRLRFASLLLLPGLAGCTSANWQSVFHPFSIDSSGTGQSISIDAKQRAIITANVAQTPNADRRVYVCAEPSPDALSAVSSSLSTSGKFSQAGGSPQIEAALAMAVQEAAAQLRRGRTVQLLRDGLYRACEGFLNGALTWEKYGDLAHKYADATVTLMAIEQITPPDPSPQVSVNPGSTRAGTVLQGKDTGTRPSTKDGIDPAPQGDGKQMPESKESPQKLQGTEEKQSSESKRSSTPKQPSEGKEPPSAMGSSATTTTTVAGADAKTTTTSSVSVEVSVVVQNIVSQYLSSSAQNTCIRAFSSSPPSTTDGDSFRLVRENLDTLRVYCNAIFSVLEAAAARSREGGESPLLRLK